MGITSALLSAPFIWGSVKDVRSNLFFIFAMNKSRNETGLIWEGLCELYKLLLYS
jgi:hypothetical protein